MFASAISASAQQNIASFQNQQQQKVAQQFQSLAAEFQSGGLSTAQTSVLQQQSLPTSATSIAPAADPESTASGSGSQSGGLNFDHRLRIPMEPGSSNNSGQAIDSFGSPVNPSTAQQAYSTLGQNLEQGLGSDLTTAEVGAQTSTLSLTV
ncbi:MAG TPA: hypothetical protein VMD99_14450 [Terriglobales bacterium]|nr:hypothetical protein [Terriglobales bacterium]